MLSNLTVNDMDIMRVEFSGGWKICGLKLFRRKFISDLHLDEVLAAFEVLNLKLGRVDYAKKPRNVDKIFV